jgi:copper chaperone
METVVIAVHGMTCGGCANSVGRVLRELDGVHSVEVSLEPAQATVGYDPARVGIERLRSAIEDAGFEAA